MQLGMASACTRNVVWAVYLQRTWIILFLFAILTLLFSFSPRRSWNFWDSPNNVAQLTGTFAIWIIPLHFSLAFLFPVQRFLQCPLENFALAWVSFVVLVLQVAITWCSLYWFELGLLGTAITMNCSWWLLVIGLMFCLVSGGCPQTWDGFSFRAFSGLWQFTKVSAASGLWSGKNILPASLFFSWSLCIKSNYFVIYFLFCCF